MSVITTAPAEDVTDSHRIWRIERWVSDWFTQHSNVSSTAVTFIWIVSVRVCANHHRDLGLKCLKKRRTQEPTNVVPQWQQASNISGSTHTAMQDSVV